MGRLQASVFVYFPLNYHGGLLYLGHGWALDFHQNNMRADQQRVSILEREIEVEAEIEIEIEIEIQIKELDINGSSAAKFESMFPDHLC